MDITHITSLLGGIALFLYGMSIMGRGPGKTGRRQNAGGAAKTDLLHHQRCHFWHPDHGRDPVVGWHGGDLCGPGQLRYHDTDAVGRRDHGCKHWYDGDRSADPHGGYLRRQPVADPHAAQDVCAVVAFIGCIFYVFLRNAKKKNIGQIMLGFGILFTGMSLMDTGVSPLRESAAFQNLFVSMTNPILGVLVGLVVTVLIQSSSASVGILQALSSTGLVTFSSAIPIIWVPTSARPSPRCSPSAAPPRTASAPPSSTCTST